MEQKPARMAAKPEADSLVDRLPLVAFVMDALRQRRQRRLTVEVLNGIMTQRAESQNLQRREPSRIRSVGDFGLSH
jgi:hypothetical protein